MQWERMPAQDREQIKCVFTKLKCTDKTIERLIN